MPGVPAAAAGERRPASGAVVRDLAVGMDEFRSSGGLLAKEQVTPGWYHRTAALARRRARPAVCRQAVQRARDGRNEGSCLLSRSALR
jgi:hypothetical protein